MRTNDYKNEEKSLQQKEDNGRDKEKNIIRKKTDTMIQILMAI
jgi:hypothetical protein